MPDLGTLRGVITILTLATFVGICWWAYRPSSRERFEEDALLPFEDRHEAVRDVSASARGAGEERS